MNVDDGRQITVYCGTLGHDHQGCSRGSFGRANGGKRRLFTYLQIYEFVGMSVCKRFRNVIACACAIEASSVPANIQSLLDFSMLPHSTHGAMSPNFPEPSHLFLTNACSTRGTAKMPHILDSALICWMEQVH
jgi:hypothetical protein